ncbi:hypothetical protein HPB51_020763 [Rhipicephalus microplus]|uniref:Uncharacterized protein n=1 Tax=Rhipicephalus microplus TaxID=6941 RepID=A0A9J6DP43_RHIMP|nr:hypothetical protein HPB51_020763 [Rhipicephalus microplus]
MVGGRIQLLHLFVFNHAGSINSYTEGYYKPPWLSDEDIKNVVLQDAAAERGIPAAAEQAVSRYSSPLLPSDEMQDAGERQGGGRHHDGRPATPKVAQLRPPVIHYSGCLRSWAPAKLSLPENAPADNSEGYEDYRKRIIA